MEESKFDQAFQQAAERYTQLPSPNLWDRIEAKLDRDGAPAHATEPERPPVPVSTSLQPVPRRWRRWAAAAAAAALVLTLPWMLQPTDPVSEGFASPELPGDVKPLPSAPLNGAPLAVPGTKGGAENNVGSEPLSTRVAAVHSEGNETKEGTTEAASRSALAVSNLPAKKAELTPELGSAMASLELNFEAEWPPLEAAREASSTGFPWTKQVLESTVAQLDRRATLFDAFNAFLGRSAREVSEVTAKVALTQATEINKLKTQMRQALEKIPFEQSIAARGQ